MAVTTDEIWIGFRGRLFAYIRARARSTQDAEDILQDVFVKVHRRIGSIDEEAHLASWLYRVTHNTIIDHYRRKQLLPTPEVPPAVADDAGPVAEERLAPFVRDLLQELPGTYREALTLTELEGLTQAEMGRRLGLTSSGAKSRVQRGRTMLREQLLACCHVELDTRRHVIDYTSRRSEEWPESCPCAPQQEA